MINRRRLLLGAAAAAVAPTAASALPARLLLPPSIPGFIPCDGRELPIADYERLFGVVRHAYPPAVHTQTFRVPDLRSRVVAPGVMVDVVEGEQGPVVTHYVIATGEDERVPAGSVMPMVVSNAPGS